MTATSQSGGAPGPNKAEAPGSLRQDARVLGPVGGAHFLSHYLIFLLPPVLPLLKADFGVGYAALGLIMTVYNVSSGLTHVPMGFAARNDIGRHPTNKCGHDGVVVGQNLVWCIAKAPA